MAVNQDENMSTVALEQEKKEQIENKSSTQNSTAETSHSSTEESKEDPNWRAFREARKKDRLEREAAERRAAEKEAEVAALKAAMEAAFSRHPTDVPSSQYSYPEEETEDQRIQKKIDAALAAREAQYQQQLAEKERQEYPQRLNQTYSDFNAIISQENLDYLDYHYPEVSRPLQRLQDGYEKWSDIYLAIKKFVPNHSTAQRDAKRAEINQNKPKSMSSVGLSQNPADAPQINHLSKERRAANWERMQRTLKGVG